jgi:hypothetical protein
MFPLFWWTSTLTAIISFGIPWLAYVDERQLGTIAAVRVAFGCLGVWLISLLMALVTQRARGLWLLVGAPFVLWWPSIFSMIIANCATNIIDIAKCP